MSKPFQYFDEVFADLDLSKVKSSLKFTVYADKVEKALYELALCIALSEHYILLHNIGNDKTLESKYTDLVEKFNSKKESILDKKNKLHILLNRNNEGKTVYTTINQKSFTLASKLLDLLFEGLDSLILLLDRIKKKLDSGTESKYYGFEYKLDFREVYSLLLKIVNQDSSKAEKIGSYIHFTLYFAYFEDEVVCSEFNIRTLRKLKDAIERISKSQKFLYPAFDVVKSKVDYLCFKVEARRSLTSDVNIDGDSQNYNTFGPFDDFYKKSEKLYEKYHQELSMKVIISSYNGLINPKPEDNFLLQFVLFSKYYRIYTDQVFENKPLYEKEIHSVIKKIESEKIKNLSFEYTNSLINEHSFASFKIRKLLLLQEIMFKQKFIEILEKGKSNTLEELLIQIKETDLLFQEINNEIIDVENEPNHFTTYFIESRQVFLMNCYFGYLKNSFNNDIMEINSLQERDARIAIEKFRGCLNDIRELEDEYKSKLEKLYDKLEDARRNKFDPIYIDFDNCIFKFDYSFEAGKIITREGFLDSSYIYPVDYRYCGDQLNDLKSEVTYNLSSFITSLERKLSLVVDINDAKLSFKDNLRDLEAKTQFNTVQVVSLFVVLVTFILGGVKITYDTLLSFPKSQFTQFPKVNNFGDSMLLISKTEIQRMVNEAANNNDKIIKSFTHEVMPTFLLFFAIGLLLFVAMGRFLFVNLGGKSMLVPIFISGLLLAIAIFIYLLD